MQYANAQRNPRALRYGHPLTLRFVEALSSVELTGSTYQECFAEITKKLPEMCAMRTDIAEDERTFLNGLFEGMRVWVDTFALLEHTQTKRAGAEVIQTIPLSAPTLIATAS